MSVQYNKNIVERFWKEVLEGGNLDMADELFASDHVLHELDLPEGARGSDVMKGIVVLFRKISPDAQVVIEDQIAEGDKVVSRWSASGTLAEELKNDEITSDKVTISGISIFRLSNGAIEETWQRIEGREALMPSKEIQEWLFADQLISDLIRDESVWRKIGGWVCRICGCCAHPGDDPQESS